MIELKYLEMVIIGAAGLIAGYLIGFLHGHLYKSLKENKIIPCPYASTCGCGGCYSCDDNPNK